MEIKLKSALKNPISQLLFKAVFFGLALAWSPIAAALVAIWLYFRQIFNSFSFLISFLIWLFLAVWMADIHWLVIIAFSVLFAVLLGLKNLVFVERRRWYLLFNFSLFYASFISFFLINQSSWFTMKWLLFLAVAWLLFRELFKVLLPDLWGRLGTLHLVSALVVGELMWVVSWLPIGFLNSANLMILSVFLIADLATNYYWRTLNNKIITKDAVLFSVLFVLIVLSSRWTL